MLDGVRMIGANKHALKYAGVRPLRRSGKTEYIKIRVVGEDRMALKDGPRAALSAVGSSKVAETPEDTASGKTRNSEGGNGQGSAALLSDPPISNHSRALGGGAKLRRAAHAEVPSAKLDLVNTPIKETITQPRLDNSGNVWGRGAGEKVPETQGLSRLGLPGRTGGPDMGGPDLGLNLGPKNVKKFEPVEQILERRKPEENNPPNLGPKNVKKLELPHKPRVIKKAKRQKKHTSVRNEDQLPITNFLRGVPTPDDSNSKQQGKVIGTATPGSGPGLGVAVQTVVQKKLNKRKFTDNEDFLRETKFVKMEKSDTLPHMGGLEVGEVKTPSALKSEGETLVNRSNNKPDTSTRNLNIKHEFLNIIERGDKLITPSQLIDPSDLITANLINPKIEGGHSFHCSLVNNGFNEAQSQKHLGIKDQFYQESDSNHSHK